MTEPPNIINEAPTNKDEIAPQQGSIKEAAIEGMVHEMGIMLGKIEHLETHLESCMAQFKYMSDRFHDNITYINRLKTSLATVQDEILDINGRLEPLAPIRKHCINPTCRRLLNDQSTHCNICVDEQSG